MEVRTNCGPRFRCTSRRRQHFSVRKNVASTIPPLPFASRTASSAAKKKHGSSLGSKALAIHATELARRGCAACAGQRTSELEQWWTFSIMGAGDGRGLPGCTALKWPEAKGWAPRPGTGRPAPAGPIPAAYCQLASSAAQVSRTTSFTRRSYSRRLLAAPPRPGPGVLASASAGGLPGSLLDDGQHEGWELWYKWKWCSSHPLHSNFPAFFFAG